MRLLAESALEAMRIQGALPIYARPSNNSVNAVMMFVGFLHCEYSCSFVAKIPNIKLHRSNTTYEEHQLCEIYFAARRIRDCRMRVDFVRSGAGHHGQHPWDGER